MVSRRFVFCKVLLSFVTVAAARADAARQADLPVNRIVLFTSGVGYFEHAGKVEGNAKVDMKFRTSDINDLLKSMVVLDLDGGRVSTVTYASKDPITKTLKGFAIDLTTNPTMAQLLQQLRGERVVVEAPNEISGVILGLETRKVKLGEHETTEQSVLNLLTEEGLRAVSLDTVARIKLANPQLDTELRKALATLASSHAADKKSVELSFLGKGTRRVRAGYIQTAPIWKTTYRLVLTDDQQEKPLLQGWAIVENTSEEDWNNVRLTLVSGRPISFTMDLYQPLYVPRPEVQLELYSSLMPQIYQQDLERGRQEFAGKRILMERTAAVPAPALTMGVPVAAVPTDAAGRRSIAYYSMDGADGANLYTARGLLASVQSAAQAGNVGNLFQYAIATPVSLPRQQSAMLPIANADVKAEKLSIYNAKVQAKHPLYGLRFTNTTKLYLMQGPITVFDGGSYAGDARIEDLPPGSQRLVSYGVDLDTEVAPQTKNQPEELLRVHLVKGNLLSDRKYVRSQEYTVKNSGKKTKTVLVEYPIDADWTLLVPKKPTEKTRDMYRFAVEAKPGEPADLKVEEERIVQQQVALSNLDDNTIRFYQSAKVVDEKVKAALAEIAKRKQQLQQLAADRQQREQRIRQIGEDQNRVRLNMDRLDRTSELYKSYVKKFTKQEEEIVKLNEQITSLTEQEANERKSLDEYMLGLDL